MPRAVGRDVLDGGIQAVHDANGEDWSEELAHVVVRRRGDGFGNQRTCALVPRSSQPAARSAAATGREQAVRVARVNQ